MAIYHLNANVISRGRGQSIVAAAAYRAGVRLRDERYGTVHNYVGKRLVAHAEIMAPDGTAEWVHDREALWNRVEAAERRKDSQLARVLEIGLPVELTGEQCLALVRDYVAGQFVARGMVADFCIRRDNPDNPVAHILLTLRGVTLSGFGPKERRWNGRANLLEWRAAWADRANEHLARAGHPVRIDHRTLEAQQIELTPARRVGMLRAAGSADRLPTHLAGRIAEQRNIARENGAAILADPSLALRALTQRSPSFTRSELQRFLQSRTDGDEQRLAVYEAVTCSPDLVALGEVAGIERFTSRDMIEAAKSLKQRVTAMSGRRGHAITTHTGAMVGSRLPPAGELRRVYDYLVADGDAKAAAVAADAKAPLLGAVCEAWNADGLHAVVVTPRTLAEHEDAWLQGRESLSRSHVLVIDDCEMLALKPLERAVAAADKARAKVVLLGDADRLHALATESPLWSLLRDLGGAAQRADHHR